MTEASETRGVMRYLVVAAALAVAACTSQSHSGGSTSSETHFLERCSASCAAGLSCVCGVCTTSCVDTAACAPLAAAATCLAPEPSSACGAAAIAKACEVQCSGDSDCLDLGKDYVCDGGRCRRDAQPLDGGANKHDAGARDGGVVCGSVSCSAGEMCCHGCGGATDVSCGKSCPGVSCLGDSGPADAGQSACGGAICKADERCCDHCAGTCVAATAGRLCPDDNNPTRSCSDAGGTLCANQSESCLSTPCCSGLTCCTGIPIPTGQAVCYGAGGGGCPISDRNMKAGFVPVRPEDVLNGVLSLPLSTWHYKFDTADIQHIGPMAQDFKAAFRVGADDKHIFQIDGDGVSFAAIQALSHKLDALSDSQRQLESENVALRAEVTVLKAQLGASRAGAVAR